MRRISGELPLSVDLDKVPYEEDDEVLIDPSTDAEATYATLSDERSTNVRTGEYSFKLLSISGWQEVQIRSRIKIIFGVKTKVPQAFRRTSRLTYTATVHFHDEEKYKDIIVECSKQAVAAGTVVGVVMKSVELAAAALEKYLKLCLAAKATDAATDIDVSIRAKKVPGKWKPI